MSMNHVFRCLALLALLLPPAAAQGLAFVTQTAASSAAGAPGAWDARDLAFQAPGQSLARWYEGRSLEVLAPAPAASPS